MKATLPYLYERFEHFNRLCFDGLLPIPKLKLTNAQSYMGQLRYKRRRRPDGFYEKYDFTINISTRFELPEADLEDIIIHELIHYYIDLHTLQDTSTHGQFFRRIMNDINHQHQRHITVSYRNRAIIDTDTHQHPSVICISKLEKATGITVCANSHILDIAKNLTKRYHISSTSWYYTTDPFFNRFPHSRKPVIYRADPLEIQHHINTAIQLEYDGHVMRKKK